MIETAESDTALLPQSLLNCIHALDQKKAENMQLLYVGEYSSITDYFLIVTGTSNPHLKALGEAVVDSLDRDDVAATVTGAGDQSGWVVVDAFDFIIHIFTGEKRDFFRLEALWKDARRIEI